MNLIPIIRPLPRLCLIAAVVAATTGLPVAAAAQLYDPQEDTTGTTSSNGQQPIDQQSGQQTGDQQTQRTSSTNQLAAPAAPAARFQADDITSSRARTERSERTERIDPRTGLPYEQPEERPRNRRIVASEFETYVSQIVDKPLLRFGSNLLVPNARGFTAPATTAVPPDYRLNPGDELVIGVTGSLQADGLRVTVDPEGRIFIPRVGAVTVGGVRYADVNRVITAQAARTYRDFRVSVTIGQLHGITVYVTGFAATPGSYTVSSLSTLVNGVLAAGGPTTGGSFRSIELKRGGRTVSTFDLYDLLLRGDKSADAILQNGDVIYIAPAGAQVAAIGSVNNEAIYEAKPGETLADVLRDAGGVSTVGEESRVLLLDSFRTRAPWTELSAATLQAQPARRGEILRVLSGIGLVGPQRQQAVLVTVSGEVAKPGRYFLQPGVTIADALGEAGGLTAQAYPFATVFTRESVRQQQRTSFARAISDLEFLLTAQPLTSTFNKDEALQPARLQAINAVVAQLEARKPDGRLVFDIGPTSPTLPGTFVLENNDTIVVPPVPVTVGVFGAVPSPNTFTFTPGDTVGSYLARAGGVQSIGDRKHVFVIRANGSLLALRHTSSRAIFAQPALPGDLVFVPINATRGEFFAKLQALTGVLLTAAFGTAAISSVAR